MLRGIGLGSAFWSASISLRRTSPAIMRRCSRAEAWNPSFLAVCNRNVRLLSPTSAKVSANCRPIPPHNPPIRRECVDRGRVIEFLSNRIDSQQLARKMIDLEPSHRDEVRAEEPQEESLRDMLGTPLFAALLDFSIGVLTTCFIVLALT